MSNHLAIATVTAGLRRSLQEALNADLSDVSATVTHVRPDGSGNTNLPDPGVNIFLYSVSRNGAQANADLPTRAPDGRVIERPRAALDLHYLLSFYGDDGQLIPQRMMGTVVRTLHARPILTRALIQAVLTDATFPFLASSDLANAMETVKLTPEALTLEELSHLWSVFFQTPYALSVAYQASVVLIEGQGTPGRVLPVQAPSVLVLPNLDGAAAPSAAPDELPALQVWLKSDAGVTYDADGVSAWGDQSGNGVDAVQASATRRPAFVAHGLGRKPVLRFDGTDDRMPLRNLSYNAAGALDALTVCALIRSDSSGPQMIVSFDRSEYWRLVLKTAAGGNLGFDTTDSTGTTRGMASPQDCADSRWHLVCGWFDRTAAPSKRLFIDGVEVAAATPHAGNALGSGAPRFGYLGVGSEAAAFEGATGPNWFFAGDLAELAIFHHALTDDERRQLERYFAARYRP